MLLSGATLIVELNDPVCLHWHIGNDKTNPREQFTRMPFHLGDDTTGFVPGRSLILKVAAGASHMVGRTAHRALEQMRNPALKNTIGAQTDGIEIALRFEHPVEVWDGEGGSAPGRGVIPTLARAEWSLARSSGEVRAPRRRYQKPPR